MKQAARFVSVLSFNVGAADVSAISGKVQRAIEQRLPYNKGFIGCMVMLNPEKSHLLVVSIWESGHAWSAAQYDETVGRVVSDLVETTMSYEIQTYETVSLVRG